MYQGTHFAGTSLVPANVPSRGLVKATPDALLPRCPSGLYT